jgi:hypothetical protein
LLFGDWCGNGTMVAGQGNGQHARSREHSGSAIRTFRSSCESFLRTRKGCWESFAPHRVQRRSIRSSERNAKHSATKRGATSATCIRGERKGLKSMAQQCGFACPQKPAFARPKVSIAATYQGGRVVGHAICPRLRATRLQLCVSLLSNCITRKGCVYRADGGPECTTAKPEHTHRSLSNAAVERRAQGYEAATNRAPVSDAAPIGRWPA